MVEIKILAKESENNTQTIWKIKAWDWSRPHSIFSIIVTVFDYILENPNSSAVKGWMDSNIQLSFPKWSHDKMLELWATQ